MTQHDPAGVFKAKCLGLREEVRQTRKEIMITKRSKPVARLVPVDNPAPKWFGGMEGTGEIPGDIIAPIDVVWDAER